MIKFKDFQGLENEGENFKDFQRPVENPIYHSVKLQASLTATTLLIWMINMNSDSNLTLLPTCQNHLINVRFCNSEQYTKMHPDIHNTV